VNVARVLLKTELKLAVIVRNSILDTQNDSTLVSHTVLTGYAV